MAYNAKILADSIVRHTSGSSGGTPALRRESSRLTTFEVTYPRFVHAELMTHRLFSRNSASSRAIPTEKLLKQIEEDPAMPVWWGKNQAGMAAREELSDAGATISDRGRAQLAWLAARDQAVAAARQLGQIGLHKQIANRVVEPWMWITVIVSATEWTNAYAQRCHPDAQPEIRKAFEMMRDLQASSTPEEIPPGGWHLPLVKPIDVNECCGMTKLDYPKIDETAFKREVDRLLVKLSAGRCARVSYLTHNGVRDLAEDFGLHDKMKGSNPGHWSPFEHPAQALATPERVGNYIGWKQYRKFFEAEHIGGRMP